MTGSRAIVLELLRDGPPHNQLLSPLTSYLAACQNRPPESLRLTIEHRDFLRWQAGLTYAAVRRTTRPRDTRGTEAAISEVERRNAIDDATKAVTNVLGSIRALIAELASEPCEWRHIHLVLDATELGALPFELAYAAPGLMVEGERLFAQQNTRVTLTRQTRRVATSVVSWPSRPRILCIIADGPLPADAHVLALRNSIDPWIGWNDGDESDQALDDGKLLENRRREAEQMMTVLDNPTLEEVSETARRGLYTHVHVLAHGAPLPYARPGQSLYGLCFRGSGGTTDVVDGDRLEAALRQLGDCTHPTVVTLATCEGANVSGGILGPGGSAAHGLHAKGAPLVVASQFPLSKGASVIVTEMLYGALLRGDDPREAVHAIRRELLVAYPDTHDWASLVMYASFPADLEEQLHRVKRTAEKLAAETAIERLRVTLRGSPIPPAEIKPDRRKRLEDDVNRLDRATATIRSWTQSGNNLHTRIAGHRLFGRVALRMWDVYTLRHTPLVTSVSELLDRAEKHDVSTGQRPVSMLSPQELLRLAKDSYEAAYLLDGSRWEVWVQVVALSWALGVQPERLQIFNDDLRATRYMGVLAERVASEVTGGREERALAAAIGFEVELLAYLAGMAKLEQSPHASDEAALEAAFNLFIRASSPVSASYRAHAAWRQLRRYEKWATALNVNSAKIPKATNYRERLETLGVRRYWGPRA